ncbi:MAG: chromate transporter [Clostridiales bacterium]|nr:chromate transporter [Clostridiales bacterium]MDY4008351.1 chromate transporter [Candidatus Limiplasma sp.]
MIYLELLWSFFQIGLFSIGGGYAAMPLIQRQVVDAHSWLTMTQFADIMTIAEMTPGPIAINSATFVGIQVAGIPGAIIATLGCVLPSCVIVMTLAFIYYRFRGLAMVKGILAGLRPAVVAMIASAGISLVMQSIQNYVLTAQSGRAVVQILHKGLAGGWSIEADDKFPPEIICGIFLFCRYIEQENEFNIV